MNKIEKVNTQSLSTLKKWGKRTAYILFTILSIWAVVSVWAEMEGTSRKETLGNAQSKQKVLIVYDADPFYNLDQQMCTAFGRVFADSGWAVTLATVPAADDLLKSFSLAPKDSLFDIYVFCANTYNWAPDRAISRFIKEKAPIEGKNVVAITLGSGSTDRSQKLFENMIWQKQGLLLGSRTFWLSRPNDESRMKESNVAVAVSMATDWAKETVSRLNKKFAAEQAAVK